MKRFWPFLKRFIRSQQHEIRHACSEIYLIVKHTRMQSRLDDQEYQLIIAQLRRIENALSGIIENELQ